MKSKICFFLILTSLLQIGQSQTWNPLGSGLNGTVNEIVIDGNNIYVGGYFTNAGGIPDTDYLARWDGVSWHAVAPGLDGAVEAILVRDSDIYVGGIFSDVGGIPNTRCIARWDGSSWNAVGGGLNNEVFAIALWANDIYVGGSFTNAGGNSNADHVARLDGSSWKELGFGILHKGINRGVFSMAADENNLYVGGEDVFVCKLDVNGNFVWARRIGAISWDFAKAITIDPGGRGDIYTTGHFSGTVDFDPGSGIYNLTSSNYDAFISKLDASGNFVWAKDVDSPCGSWGSSVAVEVESGDVYTTGWFACTADFDPGPGTYNLTSSGGTDIFISKLSNEGDFQWAKRAGGTDFDQGAIVRLTEDNNLYLAGEFWSLSIDFGTTTLTNSDTTTYYDDFGYPYYSNEIFTAKLNSCSTIVTNTNNSGPGSLRDIIACSSSGGTITFDLPLMSQITLTSGEIIINKDLTISGPGQMDLTISGNNHSRIFNLFPGKNFSVSALSLKNTTTVANGGAIFSQGNLMLNNLVLENNWENGIPKALTLYPLSHLLIQGNVEFNY